jgi:hypothetical protein
MLRTCSASNRTRFETRCPVLRRAIEGFGPERIMWASASTQARTEMGITWAQALYYLLDSDQLSNIEKEWLLGASVRKALNWSTS